MRVKAYTLGTRKPCAQPDAGIAKEGPDEGAGHGQGRAVRRSRRHGPGGRRGVVPRAGTRLVEQEPGTTVWYAIRMGPSTFGSSTRLRTRTAPGPPQRCRRPGARRQRRAVLRARDPPGGHAAASSPSTAVATRWPGPASHRRRRPAHHRAGAVLRPGLRVRDHAGLAPAARPSDLGGRRGGDDHPARALVGMELHDLGDQRARPGVPRRAGAAARDHARQPPARGRHPRRVRRPPRCSSRVPTSPSRSAATCP